MMATCRRIVAHSVARRVQQREYILAIVQVTNAPATMVQSDHGCVDKVRVKPGRAGNTAWEDDRPFTERDRRNITMMCNSLGYQIDRIGIVEQSGVRTDC